ncbi:molybdopterin molybdotransferase MoeA [Pontibacter qinzhouensis]|uniref:Molybdopterin molybdenumtransferase n=1 Tax=Pontibacter qinzhouensis TaxID=2603253 RepID=A0A5C8KAY5_9BACT|nr:molybdopterin molybdotransferase MoeA [Pontibacter qinzhouensis]TXK48726.1 molybdopterin molybdotransferase MoeA [Pontibacter qinzhouensis]
MAQQTGKAPALMAIAEAQQLVKTYAKSFGQEQVALDEADGRVLAAAIRADRDYPPFNRSAVDGYAIRTADWEQGQRNYPVQETIFAGQAHQQELQPGFAYKIMTGAAVPTSANAVFRREDTTEGKGAVEIKVDTVTAFQNIARQGEDVQQEEVLVPAPILVNPSVINSLAAVGQAQVLVEKLPRIALFTTGDEVKPVDAAVSPIQIRNSNRHLLEALLRKWKLKPDVYQHIPDTKEALHQAIQEALQHDMIIMSGGVSAGDADYVPQVLQELGIEKLFHKLAIRPGKPVFCGKLPNGGIVFALPGNPFSCLVTFTLLIEHYLYHCFGFEGGPVYNYKLQQQRTKKHQLAEFFTVKINKDTTTLQPLQVNGSGDIRAGLMAHGLGVHPAEQQVLEQGQTIEFISFSNSLM